MSVEVRSQQLLFVLFFFSPFKFSVEAKRMTSVEFFFHQMSLTDLNSGYWHWVMICSLSSKYFITLHGLRISAKVLHLESWQILSPLMFVEAPQLSSCCFSLSVRIHSTQETPGFFVLLFSFHSGFETTKLLRVTVGQWGSRRGACPTGPSWTDLFLWHTVYTAVPQCLVCADRCDSCVRTFRSAVTHLNL